MYTHGKRVWNVCSKLQVKPASSLLVAALLRNLQGSFSAHLGSATIWMEFVVHTSQILTMVTMESTSYMCIPQ